MALSPRSEGVPGDRRPRGPRDPKEIEELAGGTQPAAGGPEPQPHLVSQQGLCLTDGHKEHGRVPFLQAADLKHLQHPGGHEERWGRGPK